VVTRTTADAAQVTAHSLLGAKRMTWSDMDGLELRDARWTVAVGKDGRRLPLPMVRPRDLPRLATASGGTLNLDAQASGDEDADIAEGAVGDAAESADAGAAGDADAGAGSATGDVSTTGDITNDAPIRPAANAPDEGTSAQDTAAQDTADSASDRDGRAITADAQGAGRASSAG
ncbi:MAG TPA: PH domain-containing protein, partial [Mycobacterium sp.]